MGTATPQIYTLSLHDALPISDGNGATTAVRALGALRRAKEHMHAAHDFGGRSEEHTSELQSHHDLVCRLLLEKKKKPSGIQLARVYGYAVARAVVVDTVTRPA